jgi:broad specificity phosphatase PhoE
MAGQFVYIARHGLTIANEAGNVQGFDDSLSEQGHRQAARLAERTTKIPFEFLLSSDMPRALETASYITAATGKEAVPEALLREVKQDDSFVGLPGSVESFQQFLKEEAANLHNPDWRFGTADTFYDSRARALAALKRFEEYGELPLFVVSHGHFIRCLVATVMLGLSLTPDAWAHMSRTIRTHNTGISILRRDLETGQWVIHCLNDHAHFADD